MDSKTEGMIESALYLLTAAHCRSARKDWDVCLGCETPSDRDGERRAHDCIWQAILLLENALEQERYVEEQVGRARETVLGGQTVPCINTTFAISELVDALAEGKPFAAGWFQRDDGRFVYSLRSRKGGIDVSEIARQYGGGGHRNAAGFTQEKMIHD